MLPAFMLRMICRLGFKARYEIEERLLVKAEKEIKSILKKYNVSDYKIERSIYSNEDNTYLHIYCDLVDSELKKDLYSLYEVYFNIVFLEMFNYREVQND